MPVDPSVNLVKAQASIFDLTLGAGLEAGIEVKNGLRETKVGGCGVIIGTKARISALGSGLGG
jgi:hypothetical protein